MRMHPSTVSIFLASRVRRNCLVNSREGTSILSLSSNKMKGKAMPAARSRSDEILLPQMWLRKLWLRRALRDYPTYDPPHKVEERLLSPEKARENFDYFMRVRLQRMAYFREWLRRYFRIVLTPDTNGVKALNRWGNKYAGLLLEAEPSSGPTNAYFTYDPAWIGNNAGCNVVFDMGIALGESVIASCPRLYWDLDPISATLPRTAKILKRESGMSFQRPRLTGSDNPAWSWAPLHYVHSFAYQMMRLTTHPRACRHYRLHSADRRRVLDTLFNNFTSTINGYPGFGVDVAQREMSLGDYLNIVDSESEEDDSR